MKSYVYLVIRLILQVLQSSFFFCIFTFFVVFRDIIYAHDVEDDRFVFDFCLDINEIVFTFCEVWSFVFDVRDWIKFIIWFNFLIRYDWIFLIFSSIVFSIRISMLDDFFFRICSCRSQSANFAHFAPCLHFASLDLHFRFNLHLNSNSNLWNLYIDLVVREFFELRLFDSRSLNLMHDLCTLHCFSVHVLNS